MGMLPFPLRKQFLCASDKLVVFKPLASGGPSSCTGVNSDGAVMVCHGLKPACFNTLNECNGFSASGCSRGGSPPGGNVGLSFML